MMSQKTELSLDLGFQNLDLFFQIYVLEFFFFKFDLQFKTLKVKFRIQYLQVEITFQLNNILDVLKTTPV